MRRYKQPDLTLNHVHETLAFDILIGTRHTSEGVYTSFKYNPLDKEFYIYQYGKIIGSAPEDEVDKLLLIYNNL